MASRFILNETSYFGAGSREALVTEINGRGVKKVFVVTDKDLVKFGVCNKVLEVLAKAGIAYEMTDDVKANPTIKNVLDALAKFQASHAELIVAVGGGSVMDTAKAVGIINNNPEFSDVRSLEGVAATKNKCVPIIALPTTAGTAAEVTINYVITDEENGKKMVCVDPHDIPVVAIVDAELMASMPKGLTAATGMDALTHAIEGFITPGAWEMSDMVELKAIELIGKNLRAAVNNGSDMVARENMALAQYIAGMGFSNVGLGIVHSMAHPLGARFDTPHGVANAIILPTVMKYNMESASLPKYRKIAEALGGDTTGLTDEEAGNLACDLVKKLSEDIGIPSTITAVGIPESAIDQLSVDAFNDVCTGGNPRPTSVEDIKALYKSLL
ncbi:MAG: lactaldehyde reductase [Bacilli bacterium]